MPPTSPIAHGRFVPGTLLAGRYRIVALQGRGGMGEVYRADDLKLGETVALKFLPETLERDADLRQHMLDETRIARRVSHPNVCRVYDVGEVDGRLFLTMEFVDGEDLASLLRRIGRLPGDKAVQVARELCAGLQSVHDAGILHRDLKPSTTAALSLVTRMTGRRSLGVVAALFISLFLMGGVPDSPFAVFQALLPTGVIVTVFLRGGLLSMVIAFYAMIVTKSFPFELPGKSWYWDATMLPAAVFAALALWGFVSMMGAARCSRFRPKTRRQRVPCRSASAKPSVERAQVITRARIGARRGPEPRAYPRRPRMLSKRFAAPPCRVGLG